MRLIDADALKTIKSIQNKYADFNSIESIQNWIDNAPTVEVVRCKDCKYWQDNQEGHYPNELCPWDKGETPDDDDFCSFGERKDK